MEEHSEITLVVADDHPIFLQGVHALVATDPSMRIVASCSRGDEALQAISGLSPTVAILDLSMPGLDGLSVIALLRQEGNLTPVVILTTHDDPLLVERARSCGANAYLFKHHAMTDLLEVVRSVADGSSCLTTPIVDEQEMPLPKTLTERECEVVRLVACGMNNSFIGDTLGISSKTVDNHRTKIMKKLKVHSTAELVRYAVKVGLA